jgi:hypothetical protein
MMRWPASCLSGQVDRDDLHEQGQGHARHLEGRDPNEEMAVVCHALGGKAIVGSKMGMTQYTS